MKQLTKSFPVMNAQRWMAYCIILLFTSCITLKTSPYRLPQHQPVKFADVKIYSTGPVFMNVMGLIKVEFMPAGVRIEYNDVMLYIDPLTVEEKVKADYIFISHAHADHFSKKDIQALSTPETIIIGPESITRKIKDNPVIPVFSGDSIDLDNIKFEVVYAYNLNSKIHKRGDKFVGYVITCGNSRIYYAGDTDLIPEMGDLENINVAILPIGEGKTAMNVESAWEATKLIKPDMVIPVHYELGKNRERNFSALVDDSVILSFFQIKELP